MASRTLNWVGTTVTYATASNWVDQATGLAPVSGPDAGDDVRFGVGTGATNNACTTTASNACRSLTVNGYTGTLTIANSSSGLLVGDASGGAMTLSLGFTLTPAGANSTLRFVSTSTNGGSGWLITTNGFAVNCLIFFNGAGGLWKLADDFTVSRSGQAFTATAGTFDANGKNVTLSNTGATALVNGGTVIFGSGTWAYGTTGVATFFTYTSGTITAGSETQSLTGAGNSVRTFAGGGQIYGTIRHDAASGTGALAVTGADTFTAIGNVAGRTVTLPASTTTTVTGANGLGGIRGTLNSSTGGTAATINLTSTRVSVMRAVTIQDITVTPNGHAYALDASVSTSGNTGITFNTPFGWGIAA